jgi:hypothetical protein
VELVYTVTPVPTYVLFLSPRIVNDISAWRDAIAPAVVKLESGESASAASSLFHVDELFSTSKVQNRQAGSPATSHAISLVI